MGFNSFDYITFLSLSFILFWPLVKSKNIRTVVLLVLSTVFYYAWNKNYVLLIYVSILIDYICGYYIYYFRQYPKLSKLFLIISICLNLGLLFFFKYTNFILKNIGFLTSIFNIHLPEYQLTIALPIGISFYTFQSMSYTIDIYLRSIKPVRRFTDFSVFVMFFPQLVAGPIVRASEFLPQLTKKLNLTSERLTQGLFLISKGLVKKMILSDFLSSTLVNTIFLSPDLYSTTDIIISLIAFHFQVYCDFSGYTDIAVGSAQLFGFDLPQNFNRPYAAVSPADFWRRWHMTLSRFTADYIYRPLGGSRKNTLITYRNILITFTIIGIWHGANWNYVLFGVYHGTMVILTQIIKKIRITDWITSLKMHGISKVYYVFCIILTNSLILLSLPLFRSSNLKQAGIVYSKLFSLEILPTVFSALSISLLLFTVISHYIPSIVEEKIVLFFKDKPYYIQAVLLILVGFAIFYLNRIEKQNFIYFQF